MKWLSWLGNKLGNKLGKKLGKTISWVEYCNEYIKQQYKIHDIFMQFNNTKDIGC